MDIIFWRGKNHDDFHYAGDVIAGLLQPTIDTGWCFGTWILFFHLLGMSSSQLIFFRGVGLTTNQYKFSPDGRKTGCFFILHPFHPSDYFLRNSVWSHQNMPSSMENIEISMENIDISMEKCLIILTYVWKMFSDTWFTLIYLTTWYHMLVLHNYVNLQDGTKWAPLLISWFVSTSNISPVDPSYCT